jgi:hypothetical protein
MPIRAEVSNETREGFGGEDVREVALAWDQLAVAVGKPLRADREGSPPRAAGRR